MLEQESRLPLDLTRDSSKLAGREVRIVQTRQEDEEEDRDLGAKSCNISGQSRLDEDEEGRKSSSLGDGSKLTLATEEKLGGKELGEGKMWIGGGTNRQKWGKILKRGENREEVDLSEGVPMCH